MFDILRSVGHYFRVTTILIVDDEPRIRKGLSRINWNELGFSLLGSAWSAAAALEIVAAAGPPDVLLTDVRMPGTDGIHLARTIRTMHYSCEIVFLSGYADLEYIQAAFEVGAAQYLVKPVDQTELERTMRGIAERQSAAKNPFNPAPSPGALDSGPADRDRNDSRRTDHEVSRSLQALRIVQEEFSSPMLSLASIAERLDVNPNYLSGCIHRDLGKPFSHILEGLRMEHAATLLRDSTLPVGVVADRVGYRDARYFSVRFRAHFGITPRDYRCLGERR